MKAKTRACSRPFQLKLFPYGNNYYIERIIALEAALAKKPRRLQIDMIGEGEIPADSALLIRSVLHERPGKTRVHINARSSLKDGAVLVWLSGDTRTIREDARIFFRRAEEIEDDENNDPQSWKSRNAKYSDTEIDPEEADYARLLQVINEFLPVKELAGRLIQVPVLRQFGLVGNETLDDVLKVAFAKPSMMKVDAASDPPEKRVRPRRTASASKPLIK